jgi:penicillin amidase
MQVKNSPRGCFRIVSTLVAFAATSIGAAASAQETETISLPGLREPVEIIKDRWGISHIYAANQRDLFFAQGYNVARDRLFQLELWRRQATGTTAEIVGRRGLDADIGVRLLRARVDMDAEMRHYHPDGPEIITAFVEGINAYIDSTRADPEMLPMEFGLLGIKPEHWTPEVVVSRHNGLYRNLTSEISLARRVAAPGADLDRIRAGFTPPDPALELAEGLDVSVLSTEITRLYSRSRSSIQFRPEDIVDPAMRAEFFDESIEEANPAEQGSNNWVVAGSKTFSGLPMMANDPHRSQQIPSLRYWVHLVAPGWNVIGGGEPSLPGVSIGHNESGAWGLTIFATDQEDLYVYDLNPDDPLQYRYRDGWETMRVERETIAIEGESPVQVELRFTRHGPVLHVDAENDKAYALRAGWLEIGGAPYLASLRMDQARTWEEFREACRYSHTPSENMIWSDVEGNIGWQVVGIAPDRPNWDGLFPVPGDGRFEWSGFIPIRELPHTLNPAEGNFASANQYNIPSGHPHRLGYSWSSPIRFVRIQELLEVGRKFTVTDMMQFQTDELSIPARNMVPLLRGLISSDARAQRAIETLLDWDFVLDRDSTAAAIYSEWRGRVASSDALPGGTMAQIDALVSPDGRFGPDPLAGRDALLVRSMEEAVARLSSRHGEEMNAWRYGGERGHYIQLRHPLGRAVNAELRARLDLGPLPRGGDGSTVNNTGNGGNQTSGASFRLIADASNWDNSVGTNAPGQSGDPASPHYADLLSIWADNKFFPVFFSRAKVESVAQGRWVLSPNR